MQGMSITRLTPNLGSPGCAHWTKKDSVLGHAHWPLLSLIREEISS